MISERTELEPMAMAAVRQDGGALRSSLLHAMAAAFMFISPLILFVPAAFISAGLKHGVRGVVGAIAGAAALIAALFAATATSGLGAVEMARLGRLVLELGGGAFVALVLIARRAPLGHVVAGGLATSVAGFTVIEGLLRASAGYSLFEAIQAEFQASAAASIELYRNSGMAAEAIQAMERVSGVVGQMFVPSLLTIAAICTFALSMLMLTRLRVGSSLGPDYLFRNFALPEWFPILFVIGGVSPLLSGNLRTAGLNLLVTVGFCYLLQGLAVIRFMAVRWSLGLFGYVFGVGALVFLTFYGITPAILFLAGLFDPFFDFRKLNRKDQEDESDTD